MNPPRETGPPTPGAGEAMRYLIVPTIIAVFSVLVIWAALRLDLSPPLIVGESMQPGVSHHLDGHQPGVGADPGAPVSRRAAGQSAVRRAVTWGSAALFGLFFVLTVYVDMLIAIAVVVFLMGLLWGERRLPVALAVALISPFSIFILFDLVLRVRFPRGLFTNWYYG